MDNPKVKLIEKRIGKITDRNQVISYCLGSSMMLPYPNQVNFIVLVVLCILMFFVSRIFAILALIFIITVIILAIKNNKRHILVFLDEELILINYKSEDIKVIDSDTYEYYEIENIKMGSFSGGIIFNNGLRVTIYPPPDNSSFKPKDFDIEKFFSDHKYKRKSKKDGSKIKDLENPEENVEGFKGNVEEKKNQILEERLKTKSQKLIDPILTEKDKGLITNEDFLKKEKEIIENCKSDLIQQDSNILYDVYFKLAPTKQARVERFLETIDENELIVLHHHKIRSITKEMWGGIVTEDRSGDYSIIYKCD